MKPRGAIYFLVVVSCFLLCANAFAGINDGLVAYYPFNGDATDASGKGNNGTLAGVIPTTDRLGNANSAYYFDGSNDYIRVEDVYQLDGISAMSVSFWLKPATTLTSSSGRKDLLYKQQTGGGANWNISYNNVTGALQFYCWNQNKSGDANVDYVTQISNTQWHHVAVSFSSSDTNSPYLFIDGVKRKTTQYNTMNNLLILDSTLPLYIGIRYDGSYPYYGSLDDVRIYNRALSSSEIQSLYIGDSDGDGIFDDGDYSGVVGDHPCTGGNTVGCDDNCKDVPNPKQIDIDGDGIGFVCDDNDGGSLRKNLSKFRIGSAIDYQFCYAKDNCVAPPFTDDLTYRRIISREFDALTPANEMKFESIHPYNTGDITKDYNFKPADDLVYFAKKNNMSVRGHTLIWHSQLPDWIKTLNSKDLEMAFYAHIGTVVEHFKGKIDYWDVVNEAIYCDYDLLCHVRRDNEGDESQSSIWYKLNKTGGDEYEYISKAFTWTRYVLDNQGDFQTKLFYNDYGGESYLSSKSDEIYNLLKYLKDNDVPIDGVGMQMHLRTDQGVPLLFYPDMLRIKELGLKVHITELDIAIPKDNITTKESLEEQLDIQASMYKEILQECLAAGNCEYFGLWGFTDKYTWVDTASYYSPNYSYPLILDKNYEPKKAYLSLLETLNNVFPDNDNDGFPNIEEQGPSGGDPNYDGNGDNIADKDQANVTSLHTYDGSAYVTIASPYGTVLQGVCATSNPSAGAIPEGINFPYGFYNFSVADVQGGNVTVKLYLHGIAVVNTYYKYGATPDNLAPHWYEFLYDGQTGAEIKGNIITLHFVDGKRGDDDLAENGIIVDAGGPGITEVPPTAITLSSFNSFPFANKVTLKWTTESEIDNAGFNLYRSETENGNYTKINTVLIPAKGSSTQGASYAFTDTTVQNRKIYFYKLEDIDLNDKTTMHGPVSATPRLIYGIGK